MIARPFNSECFLPETDLDQMSDMRPIDLLIGLLGVYFIWAGKIVEFLLLLLLWLFMLFTSRF